MHEIARKRLSVFLIEPSMFTPPYAAGLDEGLTAVGVDVTWITRPERAGEDMGIPGSHIAAIFYRGIDGNARIPRWLRGGLKGLSHICGLVCLVARAVRQRPDIIHYQWTVIPVLDIPVLLFLKRFVAPVVYTAHNTIPYHGDRISFLQNLGADWALRAASHIVVHTDSSKKILLGRGIEDSRMSVIPHGPHYLRVKKLTPDRAMTGDGLYTILLFGNIKPYKGFDLLVQAVGLLAPDVRDRLRLVIAGQMLMDARTILDTIRTGGLADCFDLRFHRHTEDEMAALFDQADAFVFPYRFIDASGVYYYVKPLGKWIIASRVGIFAEDVVEGETGTLVEPGEPAALARAIEQAVIHRPAVSRPTPMAGWTEIGAMTKAMYAKLLPGGADAYL